MVLTDDLDNWMLNTVIVIYFSFAIGIDIYILKTFKVDF